MSAERLQKLMSQAGIASRREAEEYITQGRVSINGRIAILGDRGDPDTDDIRVDGTRLRISKERIYILLNKPMQVVTANMPNAQDKKQTVRDLIPISTHVFPVGRLDADSEGLVLMTDDGDLAEKLTHPRFEHPKTYEVTVYGAMPDEQLEKWRRGITLDDGPTAPAEVKVLERNTDHTVLRVVMHEGRKRQIRRTASLLGHNVKRLIRTHIGTLALGNLRIGDWRYLNAEEIESLQKLAGTPQKKSRRPYIVATRRAEGEYRNSDENRQRPPRQRAPFNDGDRLNKLRRAVEDGSESSSFEGNDSEAPRFSRDNRAERPRRPYGDRPQRPYNDRPRRDFGDRPPRPEGDNRGEGGERRHDDRPRRDFGDRPRRPYGDRPQRPYNDRPRRDFGDRPPRPEGDNRGEGGERRHDDRPRRDFGDRPRRPYGDRPQRPYNDRPRRDFGDRPPRPEGENRGEGGERRHDDRPRRPYGDRPQRPYNDHPRRDFGDRPPRPEGENRGEGGERRHDDRPRRDFGNRPHRPFNRHDDRPRGTGYDRRPSPRPKRRDEE